MPNFWSQSRSSIGSQPTLRAIAKFIVEQFAAAIGAAPFITELKIHALIARRDRFAGLDPFVESPQ